MGTVAAWGAVRQAADAVIGAFAGEDAGFGFVDAGRSGFRLFGGIELQQEGALPAWCESGKSGFQIGVGSESVVKFARKFRRGGIARIDFQSGSYPSLLYGERFSEPTLLTMKDGRSPS